MKQKFGAYFSFLTLLVPVLVYGQTMVGGKITELNGNMPVSGANVVIKGTSTGTISDLDGNYSLAVSDGDTLVFSYVGYLTQEVVYSGQGTIDIVLQEDAAMLDEILLIGYGTTTKEAATGAVQKISSENFNRGAIVSADQLLSGKSAGVRITTGGGAPGEGAEIRIRGGSSLSANNNPLIVIDGIPLDQRGVQGVRNSINSINPNEIEEFVVLKDASATAIYGSRASNGVILITTKKAKKQTPFTIEYGFQFSTEKAIEFVDVLNADQMRSVVTELLGDNTNYLGDANTNWQDMIYGTATGGIHDITVSQGLQNFSYRINYNNTHRQGILGNDLYMRNAITANFTADFFKNHLKINLTSIGSFDDNVYADRGAIGAAVIMDPTMPVFQAGSPYDGYFEYTNPDGSVVSLAPRNPVALLRQNNNSARNQRNITNFNATLKLPFLEELSISTNAGIDYSELDGKQYISGKSATQHYGLFRNFYTGLNRNTNLDVFATYKNYLEGISLNFDVTAGHSYQEFYIQSDQKITEQGNLVTRPTSINRNALEGYFARINLDFGSRYFISASYRADGSSRFSEDNRWGYFPAVSVGWNIGNEEFLRASNLFSTLKLRGGYGVTGNQEIGANYGYLGVYSNGLSTASVQFGNDFYNTLRPEGFDENLKWEETRQFNVGIDLGFFDDRLNISVDGYTRETIDLLATVPVPAGSNLTDYITTNVGSTESRGIELNINAKIVSNDNWNWNVNANAALQEVEITKLNLSGDEDFYILRGGIEGGTGNNIQLWKPGFDPTTFFVFRQVYDSEGHPIEGAYVDINGDNQITEADRMPYKKATPDMVLGFTSNLSYKNFDFSFTLRGALGNYMYNNFQSRTGFAAHSLPDTGPNHLNISPDYFDSGFYEAQYFSDYYISRADFVKLDNATISYTIPFETLTLRASLTGSNLLTITKYEGLDPEISSGIDNNFYPRPRGFVFGLNFTF